MGKLVAELARADGDWETGLVITSPDAEKDAAQLATALEWSRRGYRFFSWTGGTEKR